MKLVIAEKPSLGMEIAKSIGSGSMLRQDGYVEVGDVCVTWCVGHLLETKKPDEYDPKYIAWSHDTLPFLPAKLENRPRALKDKFGRDQKNADGSIKHDGGIVKQLNTIGRLLKKADAVVHAGDAAREGQLIIDEVLDYFDYKGPAQRLWLQEMNSAAIRKAWATMKPNSEYRCLYMSAMGRQSLDFLIGMNMTRGYTLACKEKGHDMVVHVGRVQTPTICMVVARDLEIENFRPKDYFVLRVEFTHQNGKFKGVWVPAEDAAFLDSEGRVANRSAVEAVATKIKGKQARITSYTVTPKSMAPPLPFSLGDLQKAAFKQLGLSATQTLDIAQSLYEKHKLLTYPRTDYSYLPEGDHKFAKDFLEAAQENLGSDWDFGVTPDYSLRSPAWNDKKIGDHFAIRPTSRGGYDLSALSTMEHKIYKMVVKQFLLQFLPNYKYDATAVHLECEGEKFKANGKVEKELGWKAMFRKEGAVREEKEDEQAIPKMVTGDACDVSNTLAESKKTTPPARFDTASLLDAMEKAHLFVTDEAIKKILKEASGIGTPATRAHTIEDLEKREYVQEVPDGKKKFFLSTEKARFLYKIVPSWLKTPDLTALSEERLREVEGGRLGFDELIAKQHVFIGKQIEAVKSGAVAAVMPAPGTYSAPKRVGKRGARTKQVGKVGAAGKKKAGGSAKKMGECPKCKSDLVERKGKNGPFLGCSGYPNCKHTQQIHPQGT